MHEFTGEQYLKIDIASNFGLDKKTWFQRIQWFDDNEHQLDSLAKQADSPAMFMAGVSAWRAVQRGEPTGYTISLDATSSGLQLLACMTADSKAAGICNLIDTGKRENAYANVYEVMAAKISEDTKIDQEKVKDAILTALYGSTAMPKQVFGEGRLLNVFYETMQEMAPAAWRLNQLFLALWDDDATEYHWVLPDNFHVENKIMDNVKVRVHFRNEPHDVFFKENIPVKQGRSLGANVTHSVDGMIVREITRRCSYDPAVIAKVRDAIANPDKLPMLEGLDKVMMVMKLWDHYKASGFLSARIFDYIDRETINLVNPKVIAALLDTLPAKPFTVVSIHDCFRVLPHYGNDIRKQYVGILSEIARSNILSYLLSQIVGQPVDIKKYDPSLSEKILEADYALS